MRQQFLLPPASSITTHPAFAWQGVCVNTTTFRWLVQTHFSRAIYTSSALEVKT